MGWRERGRRHRTFQHGDGEQMTSATEEFRTARDFLLGCRTDYDTAYAQFK
jgi:hypothetical protein